MTPDRITTDGHNAYPRAIRTVFGAHVAHRTNRYLNNRLEQDHRLLLAMRENMPTWLEEYTREAARLDDDLEWLSQL